MLESIKFTRVGNLSQLFHSIGSLTSGLAGLDDLNISIILKTTFKQEDVTKIMIYYQVLLT